MKTKEAIERVRNRFDKWGLDEEDLRALRALGLVSIESEDERIRERIICRLKYDLENNCNKFTKREIPEEIAWLEKQKAKERLDRMAPIYNDKEPFESALEKAWKYYNESASRTVDSFEDDYIECVFSKGFREGFLYKEKQKEQKPVEYLSKEKVYNIMTNLIKLSSSQLIPNNSPEYVKIHNIAWDIRNLLDYPIEQKPAEWSEEDKYILKNIHDFIKENTINPNRVNCAEECLNWLNFLPERLNLQPKQEWSEEDKQTLSDIIERLDTDNRIGLLEFDRMEKFLNLYSPQPKQEWSEEDKRKIVELKTFIAQCNGFNKANRQKAFDMIDALRPRPHWKPSEEQVKHLAAAIEESNNNPVLDSLYHALQKLL